jgi:hypothetical protein
MTTGMLAFSARLSTLGAVDESVGEMRMPSTLRAMASCAFFSCAAASLCESDFNAARRLHDDAHRSCCRRPTHLAAKPQLDCAAELRGTGKAKPRR